MNPRNFAEEGLEWPPQWDTMFQSPGFQFRFGPIYYPIH